MLHLLLTFALCSEHPEYCEYAPDSAPVWGDYVCWEGGKAWPFDPASGCAEVLWLDRGEQLVDLSVAAFVPVPPACRYGFCQEGLPGGPATSNPACCTSSLPGGGMGCTSAVWDCPPGGVYWCDSGVTNEDGTVECFDGTSGTE